MGRRISRRLIPYLLTVFFAFALLLYWISNLGRPSWEDQKVAAKEEEKAHQAAQTQPGTKAEIQGYISEAEKEIADKKAKEKETADKVRIEAEKKRADELEATKRMLAAGGFASGGMPGGSPPAMDGKAIDPVEMKRLSDARNASMHATAEAALFEDYGNGGFVNVAASGNGAVPGAMDDANQQVAKIQEQQRKRDAELQASRARNLGAYSQQQQQGQKPADGSVQSWQGERAANAMKPTKALMPEPAPSRYLLRQGVTIPVVLGQEINSQLPGQIRSRVISDVYDSLFARYLLIPKNSTLLGEYKSEMTAGDERLMIVFTRILLPDGRSVRLPAMPGADSMGSMGVTGEVNSRFWRLFGPSFLIAAVSAAATPSQPSGTTVNYYGASQTWQGVLTQSLSDTSKKIIERYSKAGPYIVVPAGEVINVIVTQDIAIPPGAAFAAQVNDGGQL